MAEENHNRNWVVQYLDGLVVEKFYGKVTLQFESGKVVSARREQVLIPQKDNPITGGRQNLS